MIGRLREGSPARMGPYETLARLGTGGMGEVFLATDGPRVPESLVAVKAIRREVAGDPEFRARFRREIAVAASVASPFVARLVAGDADAEQPWLATEYVPGPTLAEAVRRHGPLPAPAVLALGAGMARALSAVHAAGALHRDLKPANVLLGADGPKLIDFGVARTPGATTMTSTGLLVGTPGFMSPEHVAGGRHVVAASDVFCLASVLAYAAAGRDPFGDGPVAAVLYRVSRAEAELEGVPQELREVLAECLVQDPGARPGPEALAERFAAPAGSGGPDADWPDPVVESIAETRRDVAHLCAAGQPLVSLPQDSAGDGRTPTRTPTQRSTPPALTPHDLPTMSAAPPAIPAATPARRARSRRTLLATVLAVAVAGGAVGALLALRGPAQGDEAGGPGGKGAGPTPSTTLPPAALVARAGVDGAGTDDRSGYVPQFREQRPKGWKPWRGRLGHAPMSCAADTRAVVCLLTDGTYEALDASSGRRLWTSDGRSPADGDVGDEAYISPSGKLFMPGDSLAPTVRGGTTVIAHKGRLQVRDSRSGGVRWSAAPDDGTHFTATLLTDEGRLVTSQEGSADGVDGPAGARLRAFRLKDGAPGWTHTLSTGELAGAELGAYTADLAHDGLVYADAKEGVVALDERTGTRVGTPYDKGQCRTLMAQDGQVLCTQVLAGDGSFDDPNTTPQTRVTRLNPRTLAVEGTFGFKAPAVQADGFPGLDVVVSAVGSGAAVAYDTTNEKLLVADARHGRVTRREPLTTLTDVIKRPVSSGPLITGDRALTADNTTLRSVPLGAKGKARAAVVPGAPGNPQIKAHTDPGTVIADSPRPPTLLLLGGVVTLVYDQGTVVSLEIPA
ncbi:protein kinase [Streptomyces sp. NPDC005349]|uniref:serine/threonine-protein kinase n=1 Tax=Streptomyces sp. NPDC005349 TaxID=3157037 RepID=UPI0033B3D1D9